MTTTKKQVRLGYRIGSGEPVDIPVRHMCVAGQTQEAGKTTALEGLIERSGLQAITFVTKRGEGSFTGARRIDPYFREQADWQFVASILEASRGERLKFERAWIIRASKGARTLDDVQRNVRRAMKTAKGLSADVYLTLDAYLDQVVPTIQAVQWAKTVDLQPGVNAMDLTHIPAEMQHLVIKSTLDWVLHHAEHTVVVIPEAWKFIPQGRGTPVKLSAEAFIRQSAALGNYLWLDSQDIGGIEKTILRSVPVWVLGVQREANEIKRTLLNIPGGIAKPSAGNIAQLELGQFYACWGKHVVPTYAQPTWVSDGDAIEAAITGDLSHIAPIQQNIELPQSPVESGDDDMSDIEKKLDLFLEKLTAIVGDPLLSTFTGDPPARTVRALREANPEPMPKANTSAAWTAASVDDIYDAIKSRLIGEILEDPKILQVIASRPELRVLVKREVIEVDGATLPGQLAKLIHEGFFDEPRGQSDVINELMARGAGREVKINVGRQLTRLSQMGFLRREGKTSDTRYVAVDGMRINVVEMTA